ncbi:MAG TPA: ORF6N domain-containing protein, partial [bacterium]|nr:ORF6N domain-containing protein [bacterium]
AEKSIILIDNFVDDSVLTLFAKRKSGVTLKILTKNVTKQLQLDVKKFNEQFPPAEMQEFDLSHDRFLIIDDSQVYHIGASLKDLGKKWFAFSKMDIEATKMLSKMTQIS